MEREFNNYRNEVAVLKTLNHPNIIKYYQTDISPDLESFDLIIEYVSGGSLKSILKKYQQFDEKLVKVYSKQILEGLNYLHENGVVHRDLKCANILLTQTGRIKLTDFGSSKKFDDDNEILSQSVQGSPFWMAPEVILRRNYGYPADIWSFGCVLIEMVSGYPPWSNYSIDPNVVLDLIQTPGRIPNIPNGSQEYIDIVQRCLKRDFRQRPSASELLEHPFLTVQNTMICNIIN